MDILKILKKRRSIRRFDQSKEVSEAQIIKLLTAAQQAPSAGNFQSYFFYVVRNRNIKEGLAVAAQRQDYVAKCSVVFVACADKKRASYYKKKGETLYCIQDATLALYNIYLSLVEMELGAVWIGAMNETEVISILNIPKHLRPIAMLPVGYPLESPKAPKRRSFKSIYKKL